MEVGQKVQTPDGTGIYHSGGPVVGFVAYPYDGDDDPQSRLVTYDVRTLAAADDDTPVTPAEDVDPAPWDTRMSNDYVAQHIPDSSTQ